MIRTSSSRPGQRDLVALSPREIDVLHLTCKGRRSKEMAAELELTEGTLRTYIFRLCQGLGVSGMAELMVWAIQNPNALHGKPAPAGLHEDDCECGLVSCNGALDEAA